MNYIELEQKLEKAVEKYQAETFIPIKDFSGYEISNLGAVLSLSKEIYMPAPKNDSRIVRYIRKQKFLKRLKCGPNHRWRQVRLTTSTGKWKQTSIAKLMVSSFLDIPLKDLPREVFMKDRNPDNLSLNNLTFYRPRKIKNT